MKPSAAAVPLTVNSEPLTEEGIDKVETTDAEATGAYSISTTGEAALVPPACTCSTTKFPCVKYVARTVTL